MIFFKKNILRVVLISYFLVVAREEVFSQQGKTRFINSIELLKKGQLEKAQNNLLFLLDERDKLSKDQLIAINNLLGIINKKRGNYKKSLLYYFDNLYLLKNENSSFIKLSNTYNNIGNVYRFKGNLLKSIKYVKKAINNIIYSNLPNEKKQLLLVNKYNNLGLIYYHLNNNKEAIKYYKKSISIKKQYKLKGIDKVYFNLARTYFKLNDYEKTNFYYTEAIKIRENELGKSYYRLAPLYMNYGNFLRTQKQYEKAKKYLLKAINLYESNYKKRHPFTANSYVYLGKYYLSVQKYDSALYWFQKSLIANSKHFNESDITKNPDMDDCFSGLQLLRSVKMKANAIIKISENKGIEKQKQLLNLAIKTSNIAIDLISNLRKGYIYSDSKLIITEEEKECYSLSVEASMKLFEITNDINYAEMAYSYVSESKASVMSESLAEEKKMYELIPDSVMYVKEEQEQNISAYKKLIFEENEKLNPDSTKINLWENKLFDLNNNYDNFIEELKKHYKISEKSTKKYFSIKEIQNNLPNKTTLVEYFILKYEEELNLYTFVISKTNFKHLKNKLSEGFYEDITIFKKQFYDNSKIDLNINSYNKFNKVSYNLYSELFKPIENLLKTKNVILVPDEEISYISFDALISKYEELPSINYSSLSYLIYDYCFSYAYSTNLLFRKNNTEYSDFVYAFAPDYIEKKTSSTRQKLGKLNNTQKEINAILTYFKGKSYSGRFANIDSFKIASKKGAILHLAMHSFSNEEQKDFSCLAFSNIDTDNNLLYAYEIEEMKINSPMIVLSSCNSGTGKLYSGEGVMSLSRSFMKAGVLAVVHSLWNVNDDAGYKIMNYFYKNLSEGKAKNIALREAKLKYLQEASPNFANSEFWASYVLSGNISPVKKPNDLQYLLYFIAVILLTSIFIFVVRKKKINQLSQ